MGNANGNYQTTTENIMKAFDKLPSAVRIALANAMDNWVPQPLLSKIRAGQSVGKIIETIDRWNEIEKETHWYKMERLAKNGTGYDVAVRRKKKKTITLDACDRMR